MENAREIVESFLDALNRKDYDRARTYLRDDMQFIGVLGKRDGADEYIADMSKMQFRYAIQKVIADDHDVAVFYDIDMGGITAFSAGWYHMAYGKIKTFKVLFDPRPVLEAQEKK